MAALKGEKGATYDSLVYAAALILNHLGRHVHVDAVSDHGPLARPVDADLKRVVHGGPRNRGRVGRRGRSADRRRDGAGPRRLPLAVSEVYRQRRAGHRLVVVVSAMSGETDRLLGLAGSICKRPVPRELDVLLATGEQATIALLSMALQVKGCPARSYTGPQVQILTDSAHNKARIQDIDGQKVKADLEAGRVVDHRRAEDQIVVWFFGYAFLNRSLFEGLV